jgi:ring-1,2-phenylacetyl-CoA epoxidase subunit PaaE
VLSRQPQEVDLLHGRLDRERVAAFLQTLMPVDDIDAAFVRPRVDDRRGEAAQGRRVRPAPIHAERFGVPLTPRRETRPCRPGRHGRTGGGAGRQAAQDAPAAGRCQRAGHRAGAGLDLPYACKGGVCCTCRAKVLEGEVEMEKNYTLEPWEDGKGLCLTCQAGR